MREFLRQLPIYAIYIRAFHIAMKSLVPLTTNRFGLSDRRSAVLKLIGWFKNLRRSVKVFMIFQIKFPRHGDPELFTTSVFRWLVFFCQECFSTALNKVSFWQLIRRQNTLLRHLEIVYDSTISVTTFFRLFPFS